MGDPLTSFFFAIVMSAVGFYILYWVVRKAIAAGIRDAAPGWADSAERPEASGGA